MVQRNSSTVIFEQRARRADALARLYSPSAEILTFYSGLAGWQSEVCVADLEGLREFLPSLLDLIGRSAPAPLADAARSLGPCDFNRIVSSYWTSSGDFCALQFFARALLQPYAANLPAGTDCPWCCGSPQAGCLLPQADGLAFEIVCALCLRRHAFPRTKCPRCHEATESRVSNFMTPNFPHLRLQACETCKGYLQVVDLSRDPAAIPEVDELAGLPLDLWAHEQGYHKLQRNLAGI
jgi:FdhE protein